MMQNPMLQVLKNNPAISNLNRIKEMANMLKSAGNPQALFQSMVQNNPQMQQVMTLINSLGGDPKAAFYKVAKEKGVNPEEILDMLR